MGDKKESEFRKFRRRLSRYKNGLIVKQLTKIQKNKLQSSWRKKIKKK
jgi:hypothetical protein